MEIGIISAAPPGWWVKTVDEEYPVIVWAATSQGVIGLYDQGRGRPDLRAPEAEEFVRYFYRP